MATPPSCAPGKAHTLHVDNRPRLETDPVLSDIPTCDWTCVSWIWIHRILEGEVIESILVGKIKHLELLIKSCYYGNNS